MVALYYLYLTLMEVRWSLQTLKVIIHVLSNSKIGLSDRSERMVRLLVDPRYSSLQASIDPYQLNIWKDRGMIPTTFDMDRLYFSQVIWLRFLGSYNESGLPDRALKGLQTPVGLESTFLQKLVRHLFMSPPLKRLLGISSNISQEAVSEEMVGSLQKRLMQLTVFDILVLLAFAADTPVCLLVNDQAQIVAYIPPFLGHDSNNDVERMMAEMHNSFPLHRFAEGLDVPIPMLRTANLVATSREERAFISAIRSSKKPSSITAKFDREGEMNMIEVTEKSNAHNSKRVDELLKGRGHHRMELNIGDGQVLSVSETRKLKLK